MSSLEQALAQALIQMCVLAPTDAYGNRSESPLLRALEEWATKNREKIAEAVTKNVSVEKVAALVVERIEGVMKKHSNWGAYGRDKFMVDIEKLVMEKMAAQLAADRLAELTAPKV